MDKETLKTISVWCLFFGIIAVAAFGIRSCKQNQENIKKQAKTERILHDEYVYKDINGVYHMDEHCRMLRKYHYDKEEEEVYENYSAEYMQRSIIKSWRGFAATHQLCSRCFSPERIRQLDSINENNVTPYLRGRDRAKSPLELQYQETTDELYRDADEEYYNINDNKYKNGWMPSNNPNEKDLVE